MAQPSRPPSLPPSLPPSQQALLDACALESPDFVDVQGFTCRDWRSDDCFSVWDGYSASDLLAIQTNCPACCTSFSPWQPPPYPPPRTPGAFSLCDNTCFTFDDDGDCDDGGAGSEFESCPLGNDCTVDLCHEYQLFVLYGKDSVKPRGRKSY